MHVSVRRTLTIYGCSLAVDPWVMTSHLWIPGWSFHSLLDTYTHKTHTESLTPHSQTLSHITNKHEECVDTNLGTVSILFSSTHFPNVPLLLSNTFKFLKNKSLQCSLFTYFLFRNKKTKFPTFYVLFLTQSCTIFSYQLLYVNTYSYTMAGSPSTGSESLMKVLGMCAERSLTLPPLSFDDDLSQASNALLIAPSRHLMAINCRR